VHALPRLPYGFNALEPHIDALTLQIHYRKHHQAYIDTLCAAIAPFAELQTKSAEELCRRIERVPEAIRDVVRYAAGGHWNHTRAWAWMTPNASGAPFGRVAAQIDESFTSLADFRARFTDAAMSLLGCGWAWVIKDETGLSIATTANIDLWEHAYYLKYQNRRADYIKAWWNVINWSEVNRTLGTRLATPLAVGSGSTEEE
jgi:Fe-Mn family superoxide dismutase